MVKLFLYLPIAAALVLLGSIITIAFGDDEEDEKVLHLNLQEAIEVICELNYLRWLRDLGDIAPPLSETYQMDRCTYFFNVCYETPGCVYDDTDTWPKGFLKSPLAPRP